MSKILKSSQFNIDENKRVIINNNAPKKKVDVKISDVGNDDTKSIMNESYRRSKVIISEAEETARAIIQEANDKRANFYEMAKAEGYDAGFSEGMTKAEEENEKYRIDMEEERLEIIKEANKEREETIASVEPEMVSVINVVIKEILENSFELDKNLLLILIKKGINKATILNKATIHVSEVDYEFVLENFQEIEKKIDTSKEVEIIKDFSLEKGDCLIATEYGNISCGLDEQLKNISDRLYQILDK